ncbi:MAG: hypothetical protein JXR91_14485 [Deltaproteobacteria bacterium]|nr:hypothetical protein [Deltaproteobacteria bacterium]
MNNLKYIFLIITFLTAFSALAKDSEINDGAVILKQSRDFVLSVDKEGLSKKSSEKFSEIKLFIDKLSNSLKVDDTKEAVFFARAVLIKIEIFKTSLEIEKLAVDKKEIKKNIANLELSLKELEQKLVMLKEKLK